MSVRVSERTESKLVILDLMSKLTEYTLSTCGKEKAFPKRSRWIVADRIINYCMDAYTNIRKANAIKLCPESLGRRHELQEEAYANLEVMLTLIDVAYKMYDLNSNSISNWVSLIVDAEVKLSNWIKSDKERCK